MARQTSSKLLSREEFREKVFARDKKCCVICKKLADAAHHIMERKLWDDGGYYLENGASLCQKCHILAEQTVLSCEEIREAAGIQVVVLPKHLEQNVHYDKWANIIRPDGSRVRGELFGDSSVQKVLEKGGMLESFSDLVKYPRTLHLPWSLGLDEDDVKMVEVSGFDKKEVVITAKLDGENTTIYSGGYVHARSLDSRNHPSRSWIKGLAAQLGGEIPSGWRVCGENLQAVHSIKYETLPSYFLVFAIYNENNTCLSWDDTLQWCKLLELETVPEIYRGEFDDKTVRAIDLKQTFFGEPESEGYVVRVAEAFPYSQHRSKVAKCVREGHVAEDSQHWFSKDLKLNGLRPHSVGVNDIG